MFMITLQKDGVRMNFVINVLRLWEMYLQMISKYSRKN